MASLALLLSSSATMALADATGKAASSSSSWDVDPQTVFMFELILAAVTAAFVVNYFIGTRQNLAVARDIATTLRRALAKQFVEFGTYDGKALLRDGPSYFWYYATGRRYTPGITVSINLAKRMDLFAYTSSFLSTPSKDRLVFYLPISDDVQMDPVTLFIIKKKELAKIRNDTTYGQTKLTAIDKLEANVIESKSISSDLIVMSEHNDIVSTLVPEAMSQIVNEYAHNIVSIHLTEQGTKWDTQSLMAKRLIRIEFTLPFKKSDAQTMIVDMARFALHLLDTVSSTKFSAASRKAVLDLRKKAAKERERLEQKARLEEMANKKLEKKKKQEEAVSKMSAEKQRKYEEKKRKKEFQDRMKKASRR